MVVIVHSLKYFAIFAYYKSNVKPYVIQFKLMVLMYLRKSILSDMPWINPQIFAYESRFADFCIILHDNHVL